MSGSIALTGVSPRTANSAVWTGTELIVLGRQTDPATQVNTGARRDALDVRSDKTRFVRSLV